MPIKNLRHTYFHGFGRHDFFDDLSVCVFVNGFHSLSLSLSLSHFSLSVSLSPYLSPGWLNNKIRWLITIQLRKSHVLLLSPCLGGLALVAPEVRSPATAAEQHFAAF